MVEITPSARKELRYPGVRSELLENLDELTTDEPLELWSEQLRQGMCVGFDEIVHFFFDDHQFDNRDIGFTLYGDDEVQVIRDLKTALDQIIDDLPRGSNEQSVAHPVWPQVRRLAGIAASVLRSNEVT